MTDKENNEDFWVDRDFNPVFHEDFKESLDDDISWKMTNELKYTAFTEKNLVIDEESLTMLNTYLKSLDDFDRLNNLSKVLVKNEEKFNVIEKLYNEDSKTLSEKLTSIYIEDYKIDEKFVKIHVDTDLKEYLSDKDRNDKLDKLLSL